MINLESLVQVTVTATYQDTKLAKILAMVQDAVGRKAKTQQFITKFAKIYTPIVVGLAVLLIVVPYFVVRRLRVPHLAVPGAGVPGHFLPLRAGDQHSAGLLRRHWGGLQGGHPASRAPTSWTCCARSTPW